MKVYIAHYEPERHGGGWSFQRNLVKALGNDFTTDYSVATHYLVTSASMVKPEEVEQAKNDGKKVVLRCDNVLRNSRNRNTGMTRMKRIAELADLVIYQSKWAKDFLRPYLKKEGRVILNGTDLDVYKPSKVFRYNYGSTYLYSRFNRDEGKNWQSAWYYFYFQNIKNPAAQLYIVGQYSPELREYNFDFYNGENITYLGLLDEAAMADVYRQCKYFIYTYSFDACSNTLIEALCSGCKIVGDTYYRKSGGAAEIMTNWQRYGREYFSLERMGKEYKEVMEKL